MGGNAQTARHPREAESGIPSLLHATVQGLLLKPMQNDEEAALRSAIQVDLWHALCQPRVASRRSAEAWSTLDSRTGFPVFSTF